MRANPLAAILLATTLLAPALADPGFPDDKPAAAPWPELPPGQTQWAQALKAGIKSFDRGVYDEALRGFEDVIRDHADCWVAELGIGMSLACLDRNEEAVEALTKVLQAREKQGGARMYRAWAFEKLRRYDRAMSDFDALVSAYPGDGWCRMERGLTAIRTNAPDKALADFNAVLDLKPDDLVARICKADAQAKGGDKQEALRTLSGLPLETALSPEVMLLKVVALEDAGETEDALNTALNTVESVPQDQFAWHILGWTVRSSDDAAGAYLKLAKLMEKHPGQPAAHYERGILLSVRLRDLESGIDDFVRAWKLAPEQFSPLFERLQQDLIPGKPGDDGWNCFRALVLSQVALRTGRTAWARSCLDAADGKLITGRNRAWIRVRLEVADRRFKEAVALLDANFFELRLDLSKFEAEEEFHDFCASAEYHDWKFPPAKK